MRYRLSLLAAALVAIFASGVEESSAGPPDKKIVTAKLELPTSNGMEARLLVSPDGVVRLEIGDKNKSNAYEVPGKLKESRLTARFGKLGLIDAVFIPTETLSSTEPSDGCTGEPRTVRAGTFEGTFRFRGERGYTRIAEHQVAGVMSVRTPWQCPWITDPFVSAVQSSHRSKKRTKRATLYVADKQCRCLYTTGSKPFKGRPHTIAIGMRFEERERMTIGRFVVGKGGSAAFTFDVEAGTATVRPPRPFGGSAGFGPSPDPSAETGSLALRRGMIQIPFLGMPVLRIQNPDADGYLVGEYQFAD